LQKQKIGDETVSANCRSRKLAVKLFLQIAEAEKTTKKRRHGLSHAKLDTSMPVDAQ
jgi:hypothetical protein